MELTAAKSEDVLEQDPQMDAKSANAAVGCKVCKWNSSHHVQSWSGKPLHGQNSSLTPASLC